MIPAQNVKTILLPPELATADGTFDMAFDRTGFDYCVIDVLVGTGATDTMCITSLEIFESDTVTVASSMTKIVALSGSAATSATFGYAIPAGNATSVGNVITLQFDLKPRKKYIGLYMLTSTAAGCASIAAVARLSRGEISPITAAQHDGIDLSATTVSGCIKVVSG
ncbi:hypothetical protein LCGC14_1073810 [marine sediment metagenome]|uniref:Cohesin domain-containing protein n=1 Tax=marine sediment metagenome TaxID=412755 RepID=A0A0F9MHD2_9ZZZZ